MAVSEATYLRLAEEDDETWELHCGRLWKKNPMTWEHTDTFSYLGYLLQTQLDRREYVVHINAGKIRRSEQNYYIPDLIVIPRAMAQRLFPTPGMTEVYQEPLPLVVEVWSPSTWRLDIREKLPEYQRRGDAEIWFVHPYDRALTTWVRRPDGAYQETLHREGAVRPVTLPNVTITLDNLFDR